MHSKHSPLLGAEQHHLEVTVRSKSGVRDLLLWVRTFIPITVQKADGLNRSEVPGPQISPLPPGLCFARPLPASALAPGTTLISFLPSVPSLPQQPGRAGEGGEQPQEGAESCRAGECDVSLPGVGGAVGGVASATSLWPPRRFCDPVLSVGLREQWAQWSIPQERAIGCEL